MTGLVSVGVVGLASVGVVGLVSVGVAGLAGAVWWSWGGAVGVKSSILWGIGFGGLRW